MVDTIRLYVLAAERSARTLTIVLTPDAESGELQIEVRGDLAGILTIALERKKPADGAAGSQVEMVAGTGFEPVTFRL